MSEPLTMKLQCRLAWWWPGFVQFATLMASCGIELTDEQITAAVERAVIVDMQVSGLNGD